MNPEIIDFGNKYSFKKIAAVAITAGLLIRTVFGEGQSNIGDGEIVDCVNNSTKIELSVNNRLDEFKNTNLEVIHHIVDVDGVKSLQLLVADGRDDNNDKELVILPMPYNVVGDETGEGLVRSLAIGSEKLVVGVETPGVGVNDESSASIYQKVGLLFGDFSDVGRSQWNAIRNTFGLDDNKKISIYGISMGAETGVEIAKSAKSEGFNNVEMIEIDPVNLHAPGIINLATSMNNENKYNYRLDNTVSDSEKYSIYRIGNLGLQAWALSVGKIQQPLGVSTSVVKFKDSQMSNLGDMCNTKGSNKVIVSSDSSDKTRHLIFYNSQFGKNLAKSLLAPRANNR